MMPSTPRFCLTVFVMFPTVIVYAYMLVLLIRSLLCDTFSEPYSYTGDTADDGYPPLFLRYLTSSGARMVWPHPVSLISSRLVAGYPHLPAPGRCKGIPCFHYSKLSGAGWRVRFWVCSGRRWCLRVPRADGRLWWQVSQQAGRYRYESCDMRGLVKSYRIALCI